MAKKSGRTKKKPAAGAASVRTSKRGLTSEPARPVAAAQQASASSPAKATQSSVKPKSRPKQPGYASFRLQKRIKHPVRLPRVDKLVVIAAETVWESRLLFAGIIAVYALVSLALGQGTIGGIDITQLKQEFNQTFNNNLGGWVGGLGVFTALLGSSSSSTNQAAGPYQFIVTVIVSLALIWALRQVFAGHTIKIRDAYYQGMYPLVPFIIVLAVIALQMLPIFIGSALYSAVISNGIAIYLVEKVAWGLLFGSLTLLSLYMLSSSLFALYIVALPDMAPLKALRSARELVRHRRWIVLRKVLFLPFALLIAAAALMLPVIMWVPFLSQAVFFALTMLAVIATHAYMYTLYRELLRE